MIERTIYEFIEKESKKLESKVPLHDIFMSMSEELGEVARAFRVETGSHLCKNKKINESTKIEICDLILSSIELYIRFGGTKEEMQNIALTKLNKWVENSK